SIRSYDELVTEPELEAIYIPLPNSMHCEWALRALEARKAVLCEKPLAANATEASRMVATAQRTGSPLVEAFHWRYHPMCDRIVAIAESGMLGTLREVSVAFHLPRQIVPDDNIRWRHELASGALMDTGSYCVNFLRLLLGEPVRILSAAPTISTPQVDGRMQAELMFRNDCLGRLDASQISAANDVFASAELIGTKGRLHVLQPFVPHAGGALEIDVGGAVRNEVVDSTPTYVFQARAFAHVVRNGGPIRTSATDGVANMRVIDEIYRAAGMSPRGEH
ncbi:MAG: Gfo/Idh/MocA family oxidoreductase, partial [Steroidobacteraceae bacterium]